MGEQGPHSSEPLAGHRLFRSRDIDATRAAVAQKFCAHRLQPGRDAGDFDALHNHVSGQGLSLNYLRYGAEVEIDPGELSRFYLIQIPLDGGAEIRCGNRLVEAGRKCASVLNPTIATKMRWGAGCRKLLVQIDRAALHRVAEELIGAPLDHAVVFDPEMRLERPALADWRKRVECCVRAAEQGLAFGASGYRFQERIEEELIFGFLEAQPGSISHFLLGQRDAPAAPQIRRARDFIHEHFSEALTLAEIARAAGCGVRSLQTGFRDHYGVSPMQYLARLRLNLAHHQLQAAPPGAGVSEIAYGLGITHAGRFSVAYRQAFGQSPGETLRRGL